MDYCIGTKEKDFIDHGQFHFVCNKCNWKENTFLNFIPKSTKVNNIPNLNDTIAGINVLGYNDHTQQQENFISLIFEMTIP